jgi:hypothetical protein
MDFSRYIMRIKEYLEKYYMNNDIMFVYPFMVWKKWLEFYTIFMAPRCPFGNSHTLRKAK